MRFFNKALCVSALAAGASIPSVWADTAQWIIPPLYDSVTRLSYDLYKAKKGSTTTVFDRDGRVIVTKADSVTPFSEGLALVLSADDGTRMRLDRILREDKSTVTVAEDIYVCEFPFFSEGLLPVSNKGGKAGYMDSNGLMAIPFKYSNPHPFSNGLAAVSKGKGLLGKAMSAVGVDIIGKDKVFYINKLGGELKLPKEIGDIFLGSTFKDGEALVINKSRQYCIINPQGRLVRIEPSVTLRFDDRYALTDAEAEEQPQTHTKADGPDTFSAGQLLGYRQGSGIVIPAQFTAAEPFTGGRAIAARFKAYGVLGLVSGDVKATMRKGSLPATGKDVESVDLEVVMPKDYASNEISVEVTDKDNRLVSQISDSDDGNGRYLVSLMLPKAERTIRVKSNGLEVWNSKISGEDKPHTADEENDVKFSFSATKVKANSKDAAAVAITITNGTSSTLSGSIAMTGAAPSVKRISIPAGGKKTVSAYMSNITKKETRTVTITVGDYSASRRISVEPFFVF